MRPLSPIVPARSGGATGARPAESAVDLVEASFLRSFAAVNGARYARRLRRPQAIDSHETSEGHAVVRSTAWRVTERGRAVAARDGTRYRLQKANWGIRKLSP